MARLYKPIFKCHHGYRNGNLRRLHEEAVTSHGEALRLLMQNFVPEEPAASQSLLVY
ncbi:hypothetical protein SLEP1_g50179 [Rubroshorea leprosula]|uniref:Uncharacterized protein n=1 Tax=Rubroshorea leprosula TaxID=152421 RepID=A0AAV5M026_9ROSI|nr:hypothetical protein SLEP1_g50179 [Rubroshorea leprosula]